MDHGIDTVVTPVLRGKVGLSVNKLSTRCLTERPTDRPLIWNLNGDISTAGHPIHVVWFFGRYFGIGE